MNSFNEFLAMGGYSMYVWPAYGIAFVVLLLNIVLPLMQRKQLIRDLALKWKQNKQ
ncbi:MAG: heme exporter protein CcmD [Methylococcales symbiont of Iophon sp. n. MRB-2018]|nr:MAG: heme exporter protein CcmD [Methylococcales symbiont of Iophon sp. n. MRB-2018]